MTRYDGEHSDERNRFGEWREAHEGRPGSHDLPRDREDDWRRSDSQARERQRSDSGWQPQEHPSYDTPRERGWRDDHERRYGYRDERGFVGPREQQGRPQRESHGADIEHDYARTVNWNARQPDPPDRFSSREPRREYESDAWTSRYGTGWNHTEAWGGSGPFVGRGPRGYQRSDERIREDVCERLTQDGYLDASDMDVDVRNSQVILRGTVDGRRAKRRAEDIAEDVSGVQDVRNELRLSQASGDMSRSGYRSTDSSYQTMDSGITGTMGSASPYQERTPGDDSGVRGFQGFQIDDTAAQSPGPTDIRERMQVVDRDGEVVGEVREVAGSSFLTDRPMHRDTYIPFSAVQAVSGNRVSLSFQADGIDDQGWATPELMGAGANRADMDRS